MTLFDVKQKIPQRLERIFFEFIKQEETKGIKYFIRTK